MVKLIHKEDGGEMVNTKIKGGFIKCSVCGLIILKEKIYQMYNEGILDIPV
jgi:hypothetical protein